MVQDIKYSGLAAKPDDYQAPDGTLDTSFNLVNEDGALRAIAQPKAVLTFGDGQDRQVAFIHKTSAYTHYIVVEADSSLMKLYYIDVNEDDPDDPYGDTELIKDDFGYVTFTQFNAMGNTLIVHASDGMHYFLWGKDDDDTTFSYKYLGTHMPELQLSFGLKAHAEVSEAFQINMNPLSDTVYIPWNCKPSLSGSGLNFKSVVETFSSDNRDALIEAYCQYVTNQVLAKVNKFIADKSTNAGKFIFPFFVRYAYRLYDGTHTMHSSPILMVASSDFVPRCIITAEHNGTAGIGTLTSIVDYVNAKVAALVFDLAYNFWDSNDTTKDALKTWSDIIKGVDIFVSAPIYSYNQAGEVEGWSHKAKENTGFTIANFAAQTDTKLQSTKWENEPWNYYAKWWYMSHLTNSFDSQSEFILPHFETEFEQTIKDCSNFYLLKSLSIDEVTADTSEHTLQVPTDYLQSLTSREVMTDDTDSHDSLLPLHSYVYNSRLNFGNVSKEMAQPIRLSSYVAKTDSQWEVYQNSSDNWVYHLINDVTGTIGGHEFIILAYTTYELFIHVTNDGEETVLYAPVSALGPGFPFNYFYFHNANAYKIVVCRPLLSGESREIISRTDNRRYCRLDLTKHDFLNGVYWFDGWDEPTYSDYSISDFEYGLYNYIRSNPPQPDPQYSDILYRIVRLPNKLYISEAYNPYIFPTVKTVGTGTILSLRSAAKPLSTGQFGGFPMYAFATDGVWALEVNKADGTFSPAQPIVEDVCTSADAITQLDDSVLFPTARGIMLIRGSETQCLSEPIANQTPFKFIFDVLNKITVTVDEVPHPFLEDHVPGLPKEIEANPSIYSFLNFIADCRMVYDYIHQRVIIFNPTANSGVKVYPYAYVYSLKSGLWGMMESNLTAVVNSYPDALAMSSVNDNGTVTNSLVTFSNEPEIFVPDPNNPDATDNTAKPPAQLLVTRPVKFGSPDVMKTVRTVIQRGMFQRGDVKTLLFGSRDLFNWHLITSSKVHEIRNLHGSPYKYFRVVAIGDLGNFKSLAGVTLDVEARYTNNLH